MRGHSTATHRAITPFSSLEVLAAQVEAGTFEGVWLVEKEEAKVLHHLGGSTYCVPKGRFDV